MENRKKRSYKSIQSEGKSQGQSDRISVDDESAIILVTPPNPKKYKRVGELCFPLARHMAQVDDPMDLTVLLFDVFQSNPIILVLPTLFSARMNITKPSFSSFFLTLYTCMFSKDQLFV